MASYYDGLSGNSSNDNDEGSSDSDGDHHGSIADEFCSVQFTKFGKKEQHRGSENDEVHQPNHRIVIHADIDCFYCQCEHIDKGIPVDQPMAIGQKHIVVTANYAARKLGVQKLQSKTDALLACPHLYIVDGSDLERYRKHGRRIYESFRSACKNIFQPHDVPVRKLHMDEMVADVTASVSQPSDISSTKKPQQHVHKDVYIHGISASCSDIVMTEDQTGESTKISVARGNGMSESMSRNSIEVRLLAQTASAARNIRQRVLDDTGFAITLGLAVNPLLAKLASGLQKPGIVNILPSDQSVQLLNATPLRKITSIGRGVMKALDECLTSSFGSRNEGVPWTCRDLKLVPHHDIIRCLQSHLSEVKPREKCETFLHLCDGIDRSIVVDDDGGTQKTLSIENSFRQGTIRNRAKLEAAMEDLYNRLPRLLNDRVSWSKIPNKAYPTTVRLTVRLVQPATHEHRLKTGRSYMNTLKSKQTKIHNAQSLLPCNNVTLQIKFVKEMVRPLLSSLVFQLPSFDVSRINIALTGFQDISLSECSPAKASDASLFQFRTGSIRSDKSTQDNVSPNSMILHSQPLHRSAQCKSKSKQSMPGIDPSIVEALPPNIRAEIRQGLHSAKLIVGGSSGKKRKGTTKIDHFFARKK